jgi:DNA-binding response OmpR family regulator
MGGKAMQNILIVEDDVMLNSGLCYNLQLDQYKTVSAQNAAKALEQIKTDGFDLAVLDINLPDMDGFDLCKKIKAVHDIPVIFLTAHDLESDVVKGFELGADDYITKPFSINIFRKKVAAVLRRCGSQKGESIYSDGNLIIDFDKLTVAINGVSTILTSTECRLLKLFAANANMVLTRQMLLEKLWDNEGNFVDEHVLTVYINRLRGKVESDDRKYINTVYGMGYMWVGDKE